MELLHKLGIDWKLLVAQLINFFNYLYKLGLARTGKARCSLILRARAVRSQQGRIKL